MSQPKPKENSPNEEVDDEPNQAKHQAGNGEALIRCAALGAVYPADSKDDGQDDLG